MLRISKLADYATLIMLHIAGMTCAKSAAQVAEATGISLPTTRKVMKLLHKHGLLTSQRGASGGYGLGHQPSQVSLGAIIESIEGPLAITSCCQNGTSCELQSHCDTKPHWQAINQQLNQTLTRTTLADMLSARK